MDEILKTLKTIIDNPDDLSSLPNVITQLEDYQTQVSDREASDLDRITTLQSANRNLLSQIPISDGAPEPEPEDNTIKFEDAQKELLNAMQNIGGN